ncbi:Ribosomal lysine N-methyltransferase 4 [Neolecta irregularis DAH-3]|uniref:Ribosomal lysine N-methyltransferase 4 n=1 Tax=Neolecta irregularis (strain DAH-3) TaxID=1198029 RepID=A0A1U7LKK8_NEOID|nr:Ribosomal lysine N-methyltransferase 4 [Neolecta irregularis DAH-3]|eukprot:OLL23179.1 Ribosomal lysine N-methyltransferase 4 [Neolecta irregularis DAH-3]
MSSFAQQSKSFLSWLRISENATVSEKVGIHDYREWGQGRGVIALEDILEDELLFSIPKTSLLTVENSDLSKFIEGVKELGPWLGEILTLMFENQREESRWRAYLDILPKTLDTPMFWLDCELEHLQGTDVLSKIGKDDAEQSFNDILLPIITSHPELFDSSKCTLSEFHRCGSLILACSFDLESPIQGPDAEDEQEPPKGMVPLADLLNANTELNNGRLFHEEISLDMKALKPILKGEQIFNTYGDLPNSDLLRKYGYVQNDNVNDTVEIPGDMIINLCGEVEMKEKKIEYLLDEGILDDSIEIDINGIPDELVVIISTLLLPEKEFLRHMKAGKVPQGRKDVEMKMLVRNLLEKRLCAYMTSETMDEELMVYGTGLSYRERMAVIVRLGEKKLLKAAIEQVDSWTDSGRPSKRLKTTLDDGISD